VSGWGRGTWSSDIWGGTSVSVGVTGVSGTTSVGSVSVAISINVAASGVELSSNTGSVTVIGAANLALSGVSATGATGTSTATGTANIPPTGISAGSTTGSVTVVGTANVYPTGSELTPATGSLTATGTANVYPTGSELTPATGSLTATGAANVYPTGLEATGATGSPTVIGNAVVPPTGISAGLSTGSVTVVGTANVYPTGSEVTGATGSPTAIGNAVVPPTGISAGTATGSVSVVGTANVYPTGASATGSVGDAAISGAANVQTSGVSASASLLAPIAFSGVGDAQISTAQSKFGGASLLLDGSGDYLESQGTYDFSSDPLTIDMWVRPANGTQDAIFFDGRDSTSNDAIALRQASDNLLVLRGNGTLFNINSVFSADTWVHIAVTRGDPFGNNFRVFVNGVEEGSTLFGVTASAATIHLGSDFNGLNNWAGYIDELRVSSVDRYGDTNFTPPTSAYTADDNTPVLLHFDGANGSTTFTNDGFVEAVTATGGASVFPTSVLGDIELGSPDIKIEIIVPTTGLPASTQTGTVTVAAGATITQTGVSASGQLGTVFVWGQVTPNQSPGWSGVTPAQSPSWTTVNPSQTPDWKDIAA